MMRNAAVASFMYVDEFSGTVIAARENACAATACAMLVDAPRDECVGERLGSLDITRRRTRIQHAEVRERVEPEAVTAEVAVHDAVRADDVGGVGRRPVFREEVVVRLQRAVQRE